MLKQRVITALVLMAVLLPALFAASAWPFALLSLVLMAAAGWEWGRLNGAGAGAVPMGLLLAALVAVVVGITNWFSPRGRAIETTDPNAPNGGVS